MKMKKNFLFQEENRPGDSFARLVLVWMEFDDEKGSGQEDCSGPFIF